MHRAITSAAPATTERPWRAGITRQFEQLPALRHRGRARHEARPRDEHLDALSAFALGNRRGRAPPLRLAARRRARPSSAGCARTSCACSPRCRSRAGARSSRARVRSRAARIAGGTFPEDRQVGEEAVAQRFVGLRLGPGQQRFDALDRRADTDGLRERQGQQITRVIRALQVAGRIKAGDRAFQFGRGRSKRARSCGRPRAACGRCRARAGPVAAAASACAAFAARRSATAIRAPRPRVAPSRRRPAEFSRLHVALDRRFEQAAFFRGARPPGQSAARRYWLRRAPVHCASRQWCARRSGAPLPCAPAPRQCGRAASAAAAPAFRIAARLEDEIVGERRHFPPAPLQFAPAFRQVERMQRRSRRRRRRR